MSRKFTVINESFQCEQCGIEVQPLAQGSCRNHCPACFYSKHLDINPGDRAANCGGLLEPIGIEDHKKKGYMIIHRCQTCGHTGKNKLALDDPNQADSFDRMLEIMKKPNL
ncbi:RNHCP domain-containing protein [Tumebacillus permanentifrigoris]|uniref:RNHCP domain-containing protein n=1 Tax=Tumebacillus permanentifrigoris TaxID=378543 RepID=A0A316DEX5_9BACL|nr:RNHCP domain-containing protein [Tumebacillus permanentifrigoris]PWK14517.1 RNHCP domain-containing protein [Tumebacillus permanentifrigoris]